MDRDVAVELVSAWHDDGGHRVPGTAYNELQRTLEELVPAPEAGASADDREDEGAGPRLLVLAGGSLFELTVAQHAERSSKVEVWCQALDPLTTSVTMSQHYEGNRQLLDRVRNWRFERDGKLVLELRTTLRFGEAFNRGTVGLEAFAVAVARRVGWAVPTE